MAAWRGELAGVVQQVSEGLREPGDVGVDVNRRLRHRHGEVVFELVAGRPGRGDREIEHFRQRHARGPDLQLAGRDAAHVEQIVDEAPHHRHLPLDDGPGASLLVGGCPVGADDVRGGADRGQGIAELVREHGQELVFSPIGRAQRLLVAAQLVVRGGERLRAFAHPVFQFRQHPRLGALRGCQPRGVAPEHHRQHQREPERDGCGEQLRLDGAGAQQRGVGAAEQRRGEKGGEHAPDRPAQPRGAAPARLRQRRQPERRRAGQHREEERGGRHAGEARLVGEPIDIHRQRQNREPRRKERRTGRQPGHRARAPSRQHGGRHRHGERQHHEARHRRHSTGVGSVVEDPQPAPRLDARPRAGRVFLDGGAGEGGGREGERAAGDGRQSPPIDRVDGQGRTEEHEAQRRRGHHHPPALDQALGHRDVECPAQQHECRTERDRGTRCSQATRRQLEVPLGGRERLNHGWFSCAACSAGPGRRSPWRGPLYPSWVARYRKSICRGARQRDRGGMPTGGTSPVPPPAGHRGSPAPPATPGPGLSASRRTRQRARPARSR